MLISGSTLAAQAGLSAAATILGAGAPAGLALANVVMGALGGLAGNSLVTDVHAALDRPVTDPDARRWNHDLLRAGALAVSDIIKTQASEFNTATEASVLKLAAVVAKHYDQVDDDLPMAVVTEDEVKESLAKGEAFQQEQAGSPALWTAFLHHVIQSSVSLPTLNQTVLDALGSEIARRFHRHLFEVLKFDFDAAGSPTGGRAYASVTLRLLTRCSANDERLLDMVTKLERVNVEGHRITHEKLDQTNAKLDDLAKAHHPIIAYCAELQRVFEVHENLGLPPPGNPEERDEPLAIRQLFVKPTCTEEHHSPNAFDQKLREEENPAKPLLPLLVEHKRVVLLADPGMGKSTLVQWLINSLAGQMLDPEISTPFPGAIPLPFILRDLVPLLPDDHQKWTWTALLKAFKEYKPGRTAAEALAAPLVNNKVAFATLLKSDHTFFLIDGLDEIGDPERRKALRDALWQGFESHPQARFLVTSRIVGYDEAVVHEEVVRPTDKLHRPGSKLVREMKRQVESSEIGKRQGLNIADLESLQAAHATLLYLAPFDDSQQDLFARNWYLPRLGEAAGTERAAIFMEAVRRHPSTQVIGRVPNLLYLLALLYRHKAHLPDGRAQVYAAISDAYLEGIPLARQLQHQPGLSVPYTLQEKESFLATIAMHVQVRRGELAKEAKKKREEHSGEVLATSAELRQWLAPSFNGAQTPEDCAAVDEFIQFVARRAGLLLPRGEGVFAFAHLSFQEYYAARHLKAEFSRLSFGSDDPENLPVAAIQASYEKLIEWSREASWREVFIFLVESQKEDVHITWALVQKVFLTDAAKDNAEEPDQSGQPHRCLPLAAAELLASLSINRDVSLHDSHRQKIWSSLWQAYLRWSFKIEFAHPWAIAPSLLQATPYQPQVVQALVEQAAMSTELSLRSCNQLANFFFLTQLTQMLTLDLSWCPGFKNLGLLRDLSLQSLYLGGCAGVECLEPLCALPLQSLNLGECTGVTSLEPLRALSLQSLRLWGCAGVTSLEPLRALPLQSLNLNRCTGVTSLEPLCALPLQELNLDGCTGVTSLEPLRAVPLQTLDLSGCTGVTNLEPLRALPLQSLDLSGCTGVTEAEVAALKQALPGCKITGR